MSRDVIEQAIVATQKALDCNLGEYDSYSGGGTACFEHETDLNDKGNCPVASALTHALADAGLLARPLPSRDDLIRSLQNLFWPFLAHNPHNPERFWGQSADTMLDLFKEQDA